MKHMYGLCMDVECVGLCWMLNVLDLMYVWMLNECVCRCDHLLCEILYAHVFCHVLCVLCVMCMLSSLFLVNPGARRQLNTRRGWAPRRLVN